MINYYIPDDHERIERILFKIKRLLSKLDSSGLTIQHIFRASKKNQYKLFKQFIVNLEIWGSYQNLNVYDYEIFTLDIAKRNTENQINLVLECILEIIKEENFKNYPFLVLLIKKVGCIAYFLSEIESHLISKSGGFRQSLNISSNKQPKIKPNSGDEGNIKDEDEENMTLLEPQDTEIQEESTFIRGKNSSDLHDLSEVTQEKIGYLIPLS